MKKYKAHQKYTLSDGTTVPGVTTVLNVLNKPALVGWANRLGLQGIDSTKYVDGKAEIGTCAHYLIECHLKGEKPDLSEYAPAVVSEAENGFLKFLEWQDGKNFRLIGSELQLVSEKYRYGGTIDIYAEIDGRPTLVDIKTSGSGIWPEMRHQVAAYSAMLIEHGDPVERTMIVRVGRSSDEGFQVETVGNIEAHFVLFLHCLEIYQLQKVLK